MAKQFILRLDTKEHAEIKKYALQHGKSIHSFILDCIHKEMAKKQQEG